jgi:hypothetical protein
MLMSSSIHPAAPHHLPLFITAPGETDILFAVMVVIVIMSIALIGIFYFRLHALPEHMAHRSEKIQYEIVAVLGLLSLFTHNHIYWIIGLLLALVQLPDFSSPLTRIADSLTRIADKGEPEAGEPLPYLKPLSPPPVEIPGERLHATPQQKELSHA